MKKVDKPVLVTGGGGYIGSHTCKALAQAGYLPITLDNLVYGHKWAIKWGPFIKGNILDRKVLDEIFEKYYPLAVLHFAAYALVEESVKKPGKYYHNNVTGTISLLEAVHDHGCKNFVFSSTAATYGKPKIIPVPVNHPQAPINPYGWSKLMMERILKDFDHAYGIKHASLRYFNAAGADPDGETGEMHDPETHLIPLVIKAAFGLRPYIEIYGTDYPTPDKTAIRDYIHVTDLAEAHVKTLELLMDGSDSFALNLGTGQGHSVKEIIEAVEKVSGKPVPKKEVGRRSGDPPVLVADGTDAYQLLNWKPKFTDINSIAETAFRWHEKEASLTS